MQNSNAAGYVFDESSHYGIPGQQQAQQPATFAPQYPADDMFNQFRDPKYKHQDQISAYGSIIKDLTSGEDVLKEFELRLCGKRINEKGNIEELKGSIKINEQVAREFVNYIRSIVNQNTHFSYFEEDVSNGIIKSAIAGIPYYLIMQGDRIPVKYRHTITMEAMNLIVSSVHKAKNGKILIWSKGAISEGMQTNNDANRPKGMLDYILPWRNKKR